MASELSRLIEDELQKVDSTSRQDEHQRRLTSLRVKASAGRYGAAGQPSMTELKQGLTSCLSQTPKAEPSNSSFAAPVLTKQRVVATVCIAVAVFALAYAVLHTNHATLAQSSGADLQQLQALQAGHLAPVVNAASRCSYRFCAAHTAAIHFPSTSTWSQPCRDS